MWYFLLPNGKINKIRALLAKNPIVYWKTKGILVSTYFRQQQLIPAMSSSTQHCQVLCVSHQQSNEVSPLVSVELGHHPCIHQYQVWRLTLYKDTTIKKYAGSSIWQCIYVIPEKNKSRPAQNMWPHLGPRTSGPWQQTSNGREPWMVLTCKYYVLWNTRAENLHFHFQRAAIEWNCLELRDCIKTLSTTTSHVKSPHRVEALPDRSLRSCRCYRVHVLYV